MYNRYIPQPDGTFRRSSQPERMTQPMPRQKQPLPGSPEGHTQNEQPCQHENPQPFSGQKQRQNPTLHRRTCSSPPPPPKPEVCRERRECRETSVGGFLRSLLPKDFDTADLLIVLLLLLMAGDCQEEQNTALLTLVLYLFL